VVFVLFQEAKKLLYYVRCNQVLFTDA